MPSNGNPNTLRFPYCIKHLNLTKLERPEGDLAVGHSNVLDVDKHGSDWCMTANMAIGRAATALNIGGVADDSRKAHRNGRRQH